MQPCVEYRSAKHVGVHGMRDSHFGRRVCDLKEHYFIISRRYICKHCEKITAATKQAAVSSATLHGLRVRNSTEDGDAMPQYTFMGYDLRSRSLLPHGYGDDFPAFFTHRSAVDKDVIDLMRPLFDKVLLFVYKNTFARTHTPVLCLFLPLSLLLSLSLFLCPCLAFSLLFLSLFVSFILPFVLALSLSLLFSHTHTNT